MKSKLILMVMSVTIVFTFCLLKVSSGQDTASTGKVNSNRLEKPKYILEASIKSKSGSTLIEANDPRPLSQAINALRAEYGWIVDYEDAPFLEGEYVDATAPQYRATHPDAPPSRMPSGGLFQSEFADSDSVWAPQGEKEILNKVIADYNKSGNPGKFILREVAANRFVVSKDSDSNDKGFRALLDIPISLPTSERSADETIREIISALSQVSGTKVLYWTMADNFLIQTKVTVGGENVSARNLLLQTFNAAKRPYNWNLYYDVDPNAYRLAPVVAVRTEYNLDGRKRLVLLNPELAPTKIAAPECASPPPPDPIYYSNPPYCSGGWGNTDWFESFDDGYNWFYYYTDSIFYGDDCYMIIQ